LNQDRDILSDLADQKECIFCKIEQDNNMAQVVYKDEYTLAFMDPRQFHPGHILVIPRKHIKDIRELDSTTAGVFMLNLSKLTQAVSQCFPNKGISIWHSIGSAAYQEVPHMHFHIHPRQPNDNFFKIYPQGVPKNTDRKTLSEYAEQLKKYL